MTDRNEKMKARLPRGFGDRSAADIRATEKMMATIRGVYELYGFEPVDQPLIEFTDALGKFLPDQDRPNEGVFSFLDDEGPQEAGSGTAATGNRQEAGSGEAATGTKEEARSGEAAKEEAGSEDATGSKSRGEWLSLRYDLTAPMARFVAENFEKLPKPYRSYRSGWVFRNEKPGPGRFRQFMQFDADTVGTPGVAADAEMCMMMADVMEALGIPRGQYVIRVNNRKVLDGVLEAIGLGGDENAGRRLTVLRAIDKLDKFGPEGVRLLLGTGRWDGGKEGEGDFTNGAGLDNGQIDALERFLEFAERLAKSYYPDAYRLRSQPEQEIGYENVRNGLSFLGDSPPLAAGIQELETIHRLFCEAEYREDRIAISPSVVRGLEYYTGPVYEAELLAEIPNEDGVVVRFGSVGGGGRYDGLVSRFRGEAVPACGFSIGVSRLVTALRNLGKLDDAEEIAPVVVLVMDKDTDSLGRTQRLVSRLRHAKNENGQPAGIRAEMYLGGGGMKAQIKYADRRGSPCVVIQGKEEREALSEDGRPRPVVQVKDMVEGKRLSSEISDNRTWRESRPAQVTVPEEELVATVRGILEAQRRERGG